MESRGRLLLIGLLLGLAAAGAVLAVEARDGAARRHQAEAFHGLTGGLGFGPALDLGDCACGFDPRLDGDCARRYGPVPGGACFCPRHGLSVFSDLPLKDGPKAEE